MAQTQTATNEGFGELGKFVSGELATAAKSITLIQTSCSAVVTATKAGVTECTGGLALGDATSVTSVATDHTDDTVQAVKKHTADHTRTVLGAGLCNDDDDVLYMIVCYNAGVALESGDTLTNTLKMQFKETA